jgi:hypothetical protein
MNLNVQKAILWICLFIITATAVTATDGCVQFENCTWYGTITTGGVFYNANHANITIYYPNGSLFVDNATMDKIDTGRYSYTTKLNETGNWLGFIEFHNTTSTITTGSEGKHVARDNNMIIGVIILIPLIFAMLLLFGAMKMEDEDHVAFKIGMYLFSVIPFYISLWFGSIALNKFYGFAELQNAIATTTWIMAIIYTMVIAYFSIYAIMKGIHMSAQKKNERLNY